MTSWRILFLACVLMSSAAMAQGDKIGVLDLDAVVSQLPEAKQVQSTLEAYALQLRKLMQAKVEAARNTVAELNRKASGMTPEQRVEGQASIRKLQREISLEEQSVQRQLQARRAELLQPLLSETLKAIAEVAKSKGYTHVLDARTGKVLYVQEEDHLSKEVLKKMGVSL